MTEARRPLFWEGSSKKDFKEFPIPVQKDMGVALFVVQLGRTPDSTVRIVLRSIAARVSLTLPTRAIGAFESRRGPPRTCRRSLATERWHKSMEQA